MIRSWQAIPIGAIASEVFDDPVARRFAALVGVLRDIDVIDACARSIEAILKTSDWDRPALEAYTFQALILYSRCFDSQSEGRGANLGPEDTRTFSKDEAQFHSSLLAARNGRFAHAGAFAQHNCIVALYENDLIAPGFEIEVPSGIVEMEQADMLKQMCKKLSRAIESKLASVEEKLRANLQDPAISQPIRERLALSRKHATPEATVFALTLKMMTSDLDGDL